MNRIFSKTFIFFAVVGVVGFVVDVLVLYALKNWLGLYCARIVSFLSAATTTWWLNRQFTFNQVLTKNTQRTRSKKWGEYFSYLLLMSIGGVFNYAVYFLTLTVLGEDKLTPALAVATGSLAAMTLNYVSSSSLVFNARNAQKHGN